MKKISLVIMAILAFAGCTKLEINENNILGTWVDDYSAYPYYCPEGGETYTFKADGTLDIHFYDVFAGEQNTATRFQITQDEKDGPSIILFSSSEFTMDVQSFVVTKLTKKEMEWQRLGTTFQEGTVGSDFKHFVRK